MNELYEYEMVAFFIGKPINGDVLSQLFNVVEQALCAYDDCEAFLTTLADWTDTEDVEGIKLSILVYVKKGRLVGARIRKYKTIVFSDGTTSGYETTPTEEEFESVRQVLTLITNEQSGGNRTCEQ